MYDKEKLGQRYACFQCGTKFYDLNRPEPLCPDCGADQREAPLRDIKALLSGRRRDGTTSVDEDEDFEDVDIDDDGDGDDEEEDDDGDDFEDE